MSVDMVLSIIAHDRPGLVQTVAEVVASHDGNWIDSSMARLGGEFAGIVRVQIPDGRLQDFETALAALGASDIAVSVRKSEDGPPPAGRRAHLELTGGDHPGIVHDVATALAAANVSILDLQTEVFAGSMSGEPLFSAKIDILVPEGIDSHDLGADLERLSHDIMVDLTLRTD